MSRFSQELSDSDRQAGFEVKEILNPESHYFGASETIKAVVLDLDESHRIVKYDAPPAGIHYVVQRYGKLADLSDAALVKWSPCSSGVFADPVSAAASAKRVIENDVIPFSLHRAIGLVR